TLAAGTIDGPDIDPGLSGKINIPLPPDFMDGDILVLKATDPHNREIYTWRWPVQRPENYIPKVLSTAPYPQQDIHTEASGGELTVKVGNLIYRFDLEDGTLKNIQNGQKDISFSGGPVPVGY